MLSFLQFLYLASLSKTQLAVEMRVYIWGFNSIHLISVSVFVQEPHYAVCVAVAQEYELTSGVTICPMVFSLFSIILAILGLFLLPYEFKEFFFNSYDELHWRFHRNFDVSVSCF